MLPSVGIPKNPEARKLWFAHKRQQQEEKEERMYFRWLLFEKGSGQDKNLNSKDSLALNRHIHKAHDRYLMALQQGIDTRTNPLALTGDPAHPLSFISFRRRWYGNSKGNYRTHDVAKIMKLRWSQLHAGNTEVRQQREGQWLSTLRHEIDERDRRSLGVQVPQLRTDPGHLEGRGEGPKQVRRGRPKKAGTDRDSKTLGKTKEILLNG